MNILVSTALFAAMATASSAQTPITHYPWNEPGTYDALSNNARAITGPLTILTRTRALDDGSAGQIQFSSGAEVTMISAAGMWTEWEISKPEKRSAEIFRLSSDPGILAQGNYLCSEDEPARWLVFYEDPSPSGRDFIMVAFNSTEKPTSANSAGLCGSYGYVGPKW